MRWWGWLIIALALAGLAFTTYVVTVVYSLEVEQVTDDLWVLYGGGGNVGVLDTEEGTVIVDTMTLEFQGSRIREVATELTGKPVVMVINSHYHLDHTHGNPAFESGTRVVSTERTLHHLKATDAEYFSGEAEALLPNETFTKRLRIAMGDKNMTLVWPGRGHTDGDLVVLFEEENTIHMGDLYFNELYPNIDLEAGGSVREWPETLDAVYALSFDRVIPGHGRLTDRGSMRQFQAFMQQLEDLAADAVENGTPRQAFIEDALFTEDEGYEEIVLVVPVGLNRQFVLGRAFDEAAGDVEVRP